jgi:hypothetical protein
MQYAATDSTYTRQLFVTSGEANLHTLTDEAAGECTACLTGVLSLHGGRHCKGRCRGGHDLMHMRYASKVVCGFTCMFWIVKCIYETPGG